MDDLDRGGAKGQRPGILVFSDDWGRHPSSCQHLITRLLPRFRVLWVNTIGTRRFKLDSYSIARAVEKLGGWIRGRGDSGSGQAGENPRVISPVMWPSFGSKTSRKINRHLLTRTLTGELADSGHWTAVTTIPLVADLVGRIPVDRWVYYCVDDLSTWPGLDRESLERTEVDLIDRVDAIAAVSEHLVARMQSHGRSATLLTHGVDLDHWRRRSDAEIDGLPELARPLIVFWGVVDRRLDLEVLSRLGDALQHGSIVLVGPENNPHPSLAEIPGIVRLGPQKFSKLPALARASSVLIMPYAAMSATEALQPLKLKEYLATGKPVVVSDLPATRPWKDTCDVMEDSESFVRTVIDRLETGLLPAQESARARLGSEDWGGKAAEFERILLGGD